MEPTGRPLRYSSLWNILASHKHRKARQARRLVDNEVNMTPYSCWLSSQTAIVPVCCLECPPLLQGCLLRPCSWRSVRDCGVYGRVLCAAAEEEEPGTCCPLDDSIMCLNERDTVVENAQWITVGLCGLVLAACILDDNREIAPNSGLRYREVQATVWTDDDATGAHVCVYLSLIPVSRCR